MATGAIAFESYTKTRNAISSLLVNQLKAVLKAEGLPVSGTKMVLQSKLEARLQALYSTNDAISFQRLDQLIRQPTSNSYSNSSSPAPSTTFTNHTNHNHPNHSSFGLPPSWQHPSTAHANVQLNFKESPFHTVVTHLSTIQTLKAVEGARSTHEFTCRLPLEWASKFDRNAPERDSYRIMLYGASDPASAFMKLDVAFPQQFEVKINGTEVRTNWKGLKNKPGSTRPADVTEYLRKTNSYDNGIVVTYALTAKKFYLRLELVKQKSLDFLVQKLRDGKSISRDQVLRDMRSKAKDSDIVATSTVMSLKCPLSYTRLKNPCRGSQCNHNQCFDAMSYLQLQQQAPTWTCPICNKLATFENLQIDQYVADIIRSVSEDVEKVTITPEGEWSQVTESENNRGVKSEDESEDELIEVSHQVNQRQSLSRSQLPATPSYSASPAAQAPPSQQGPPTAPASIRNTNNKRTHDVVDLTLDSDEDDSPAPKRTAGSLPSIQHNFGQMDGSSDYGHRPSLPALSFPFAPNRSSNIPREYGSSSMNGYRS